MNRLAFICVWILSVLPAVVFPQMQTSIWTFGNYANIRFDSSGPKVNGMSAINTLEGCTTVCDVTGSLLFYTDGAYIWNAQNQNINLGNPLGGHDSSTQSAVVIAWPGREGIYLLFTVDACHDSLANGLQYNVVKVDSQGEVSLDLLEQHRLLRSMMSEKIAAYAYPAKAGYWLVGHAYKSDAFCAWWIDKNGIAPTPVITTIGSVHEFSIYTDDKCGQLGGARGYLRFSPQGTQLASCISHQNTFELFDFDKETGKLSHARSTHDLGTEPYGVEFSPTGKYVYVSSSKSGVYQIDAATWAEGTAPQFTQIVASDSTEYLGALQRGIDGCIYHAQAISTRLHRISQPEVAGLGCNYQRNFLELETASFYGLPTFVDNMTLPSIQVSDFCIGAETQFRFNTLLEYTRILWQFGDGSQSEETVPDVKHAYKLAGKYVVTASVWFVGESSPVVFSKEIQLEKLPEPQLNWDSKTCADSVQIHLQNTFAVMSWNDTLFSTAERMVYRTGNYNLKVWNTAGCLSETPVFITLHSAPKELSRNIKAVHCHGQPDGSAIIRFTSTDPIKVWLGSTEVTNLELWPNLLKGTYLVKAADDYGCELNTQFIITEPVALVVQLAPQDLTLKCGTESLSQIPISVSGGTPPYSSVFFEDANALMQPYSFTANGKYSVQVTDANSCTQTVSFQLNPTPKFTAQFTTKNPSCVNAHDGEISVTVSGGTEPISYYARNAKVQAEQKHLPAGVYEYTIIDAAQCLVQDQISLTQASGVSFSIAANNPACSDQFATIRSNLQTETQWASYTTTCERIPDGKITDNQHITESGWYRLTVNETTSSICAIDSVQIKIPPKLAVLATINAPTCSQKARPLFLLIDGATPPYNATLFDLTKQQFVAITDSLTGGLYRYTVSDAHQCTHSEEFQLPVPECGLKIEIPNIFSPNSDGQNDYFSLSYENILHFKMQIFSRWGELLFETDQIESAWNGKNNSQHDVPQGVYMYVLEAYGWNGQHLTRKGTLELIR